MSDRTSLTRFAPLMREPDPAAARRIAQEAWQRDGHLIVFAGDRAKVDDWFVEAIGNKLYGKRA